MPGTNSGWWNVFSRDMEMSDTQMTDHPGCESSDHQGAPIPEDRALPLRPYPSKQHLAIDPATSHSGTTVTTTSDPDTDNSGAFATPATCKGMFRHTIDAETTSSHRYTPLFSASAGGFLEGSVNSSTPHEAVFPQFGLIGQRVSGLPEQNHHLISYQSDDEENETDLIFANVDTPWSAFICGSQGAGKSHTLSCLLENCLMPDARVGRLTNPLAAMVFHYDNFAGASWSQVCEAAYLCSSGIPVTVLVAPSNIWAMTKLYTNLPGLPSNAPRPKVVPLYFSEASLDVASMLKMMAVDSTESTPLYIATIKQILLDMAMEGKGTTGFSYREFRSRLDQVNWARGQTTPLELRLQLLEAFLEPSLYTKSTRPAPAKDAWRFESGSLTIVDLSGPFVDANDACALFQMCLSRFTLATSTLGRVVALDEAHKFLTQTGGAKALTTDLTLIVRQQRHTGTRVFIATQEPTLAPELIDLCNATFVHRFLSPAWYEVLKRHLAGASKHDGHNHHTSLFETIIALRTGEALLFCPTALLDVDTSRYGVYTLKPMGNDYTKIRIRSRLTADGGKSIVASTAPDHSELKSAVPEIKMFVVDQSAPQASSSKGKGKVEEVGIAHTGANKSLQTSLSNSTPTEPRASSRWDIGPVTGTQALQNTGLPDASTVSHVAMNHYPPPTGTSSSKAAKPREKMRQLEAVIRRRVREIHAARGSSMFINDTTFQCVLQDAQSLLAVKKKVLDRVPGSITRLRAAAEAELQNCRAVK